MKVSCSLYVMPHSGFGQIELVENVLGVIKYYMHNPESLSWHCVNHSGNADVLRNLLCIFDTTAKIQNELNVLYTSVARLDSRFSATILNCMREEASFNHERFLSNVFGAIVGKSDVAADFITASRQLLDILTSVHSDECNTEDGKPTLSADTFNDGLYDFLKQLYNISIEYHDVPVSAESLQQLTVALEGIARRRGVTEI